MSFPSLFAILFGARPRRRRGPLRWVPVLAIALAGLFGSSLAQAATFVFDGRTIGGCTLAGTEYTCPTTSLNGNDTIVIAGTHALKVNGDLYFANNTGLVMNGNARFIVTGSLSIANMKPSNLEVAGGSIEVGNNFYMGASSQTMTANVIAGAASLGSDNVTIYGSLTASGVVNIAYGSRITGNLSGSVITTSASVRIGGNVTATSKFTLGSAGTVGGNVTAPTVELQASSTKVNGNVVAVTRLTMGSGTTVGGNVETGTLLLESSGAFIGGSASVNQATLEWAGRVAGLIYCKNGTAKDKCDCVTNNSGYTLNTANGPRCEAPAPAGPHHFLITHDGSGDTCVPEKVTITACADATCTANYTKGASGQLSPWNTPFAIASGQSSVQVSATQVAAGTHALAIGSPSIAPASSDTCRNTGANSTGCSIAFSGGAKLLIEVPNHVAGVQQLALIKAVKANDNATMCVAAFANETYDVKYTCTYGKPGTGTKALTLDGTALTCNAASTVNQTRSTKFDEEGVADMTLAYPDAGELALAGSVTTKNGLVATGSSSFITVPAKFTLAPPTAPLRAGANVELVITAVNAAGATTPNFDTDRLTAASATAHAVAVDIDCRAQLGALGTLGVQAVKFSDGIAKVPTSWSEVGKIDLKASVSGFMGTALGVAGTTDAATAGCSGNVGPFIPQYFKVELAEPAPQTGRAFYYSKEAFTLQVSAMNKAGGVTTNYNTTLGLSDAVTLAAVDANGVVFPTPPGALAGDTILASAFSAGVATVKPTYTFNTKPTRPTKIRLRAANGKTAPNDVTSGYGTAVEAAELGAIPEIRSGRLRIGNAFGGRGSKLSLPLIAEYWTGNSWMINTDDNFTSIPTSAVAITSTRQASSAAGSVPFRVRPASTGNLVLVKGVKPLLVDEASGGSGWGDIAINLGPAGVVKDTACVGNHPDVTPAVRDWLRSANACTGAGTVAERDPSGRATFGVYAAETRRVIHVREVFR